MNIEPFGYFRAEPFGWTDCEKDDEGAMPLFDGAVIMDLQKQLATERASLFAENQRKQQLEQQVEELVGVLENVMPWVVTQEVACHGMKCREPVCMSCSSDSEEAAEKATYAYEEARSVIQKVRGGE